MSNSSTVGVSNAKGNWPAAELITLNETSRQIQVQDLPGKYIYADIKTQERLTLNV